MFRRLLTTSLPRNRAAWQDRNNSIANRYCISTNTISTQVPELRQASTAVESVSNPDAAPSAHPGLFLDVKIPYISQSDPLPSVQIPYVPDFWNSSSPSPTEAASKEALPKLLVVAGAATHHGGGPSHNLLDILSGSEYNSLGSVNAASRSEEEKGLGLWDDIADDVGLPPTKDVKKAIWKLFS